MFTGIIATEKIDKFHHLHPEKSEFTEMYAYIRCLDEDSTKNINNNLSTSSIITFRWMRKLRKILLNFVCMKQNANFEMQTMCNVR